MLNAIDNYAHASKVTLLGRCNTRVYQIFKSSSMPRLKLYKLQLCKVKYVLYRILTVFTILLGLTTVGLLIGVIVLAVTRTPSTDCNIYSKYII